jgi:hypothetical protein
MQPTGLTLGELAAIKKIERNGFHVELTKEPEGHWCCQVWNQHGGTCYRGPTHSEAIRLAADGVHRDESRRRVMGE